MPARIALAAIVSLLLSTALSAQEDGGEKEQRKPITVAEVDKVIVTDIQVEEHLTRSHGDERWRDLPKKKLLEARKDVLEQHIRVLVIEAEMKRLGIVVTRAEKKAKISEMRKELASRGKRLEDVLRQANSNLWFLERAMGGTVGLFKIVDKQVKDEDVKAYFDSNPVQFQERWKVRQILQLTVDRKTRGPLGVEAQKKAKQQIIAAAKALQDGADFTECVAKYSNGPRAKKKKGELPWYGRTNKLPAGFKKAMLSLTAEGQRTKIIRTPYGWHILQLMRKYEPKWQDARQPYVQKVQESLMKQVLEAAKIRRFSFTDGKELVLERKLPRGVEPPK